jgi:hypothetical protein
MGQYALPARVTYKMKSGSAPVILPDALVLLVDHRLAFVALAALTVGAAVPLAVAWAQILPKETPPFDASPPSSAPTQAHARDETCSPKHSVVTIALLAFVTLSYAIQFPSVPRQVGVRWLKSLVPEIEPAWISWGIESVFVLLNAAVAGYAIFGPKNSLRVPLGISAALVLALWVLAHTLRHSLTAT